MRARVRCVTGFTAFMLFSITSVSDPAIAISAGLMVRKAQDAAVPVAFVARVSEYAALHREIARTLPTIRPTTDMRALHDTMGALRGRLQAARRGAHQGDIITPEVAAWLMEQIATCRTCGQWEALVAGCGYDDDDDTPPAPAPLKVNEELPPIACHFVAPQLLRVLPPLPPELQYRIVGRMLVLWDYDANLVVDVLSDPLAARRPAEPVPHR